MNTPWADRFVNLNPSTIALRCRVSPSVLSDLDKLPDQAAAICLERQLEQIFIATPQVQRILQKLVETAQGYSLDAYPNSKVFLERLYNGWERSALPAICLTGLAGVGKSALLHALKRCFESTVLIDAGHGHRLPLQTYWYQAVRQHKNEAALLRQFLVGTDLHSSSFQPNDSINKDKDQIKNVSKAVEIAKSRAYRNGLGLIGIDELQFLSQSAIANTAVTKALLAMTYLGPPLLFSSNYDMVHRLKKRGQQDRDRLLCSPIVVQHEKLICEEDHQVLFTYLSECVRVSGGILAFNVSETVKPLHEMTFGLRRKMLTLFRLAYLRARSQKRFDVKFTDIEWAYHSMEYSTHRDDVEELQKITLGLRSNRNDLKCPFDLEESEIRQERAALQIRRQEAISQSAVLESLTPSEREIVAAKTRNEHQHPSTIPATSTKPKIHRTVRVTEESLAAGEEWLFENNSSKYNG
ncbi:ATP-binding protein [Deefgea rivuli]|uniref:ATP-binding protein n=1 Tax=Deefgea rivuli TaxID=400948 RepID=UPI0004807F31|nr:ATP-binding protein [Deefgea rivuli]